MAKSKAKKQAEDAAEKHGQLLAQKGRDYIIPTVRVANTGARQYDSNDWRPLRGNKKKWQGIYVFAPIDPYTNAQRKEFRSAMANPYVYRSSRIQTSFTCGHGYTTSVVPRKEEDLPKEQLEGWSATTQINVPYWDKACTPEYIKDWVDKLCKDKLQLQTNVFNGYFVALEQGRCVLAITPLAKNQEGKWQMPEQIRLMRTEYTLRPLLHENTGELKGVYAVGVDSDEDNSVIPAQRMMYIMHGFNNELFSDMYGDAKIARISDIANSLNIILNEDYPNASSNTWFKPGAWVIPIPPQEAGNEETIITAIGNKINEGRGKTLVLTGPSNKEDLPPSFIMGDKTADISGLEILRTGEIKAILTTFGIPGFMLSEGDFGSLGGDANIQEVDTYINTEINPERLSLEKVVEDQLYDQILCILFNVEDPSQLPIKIKHKFNKPKLVTILPPQLYEQLKDMTGIGLIDEEGLRDMLGLTEYDKDTFSEGANTDPSQNKWNPSWKSPIQINMQPDMAGNMRITTSAWGSMPKGWGQQQKPENKTGKWINTKLVSNKW